MKQFYSDRKAIAIKREDGETERYGMECTVRKQALKSNEMIETTRAKEQTNQVSLVVDGEKFRIDRVTAAEVEKERLKTEASKYQTNGLVKINGNFFSTILNLNFGIDFVIKLPILIMLWQFGTSLLICLSFSTFVKNDVNVFHFVKKVLSIFNLCGD